MSTAPETCWCAIPVYNNAATIKDVVAGCAEFIRNIVVIDDGSTDADLRHVLEDTEVTVIRHEINKGKGQALMSALEFIDSEGGEHMITIDGDGQHYPNDLPAFFAEIHREPDALIVGCRDFDTDNVPDKSKFGRSFSNMWLRIEAGAQCADTQSGFRSYPVRHIKALSLSGSFYDFEIEVLTRASWAGIPLSDVPINVYYPPEEERISSFRPFKDNMRISMMHTRLVTRRLLPFPHKKVIESTKPKLDLSLLKHPKLFFMALLKDNATPMGLAAAAALGTFLAVLPLIACHTIAIIYAATRLHLNKAMAVSIQNLYAPPLSPALCIYVGFYMRLGHGMSFDDLTFESVKNNIHLYLWDWLLGSLVVAPVFSVIAAIVVYQISKRIIKSND